MPTLACVEKYESAEKYVVRNQRSTLAPTSLQPSRELKIRSAGSKLLLSWLFVRRILALGGFVRAERPIISLIAVITIGLIVDIIIVVRPAKVKVRPRIVVSVPAMEIMAPFAGRESTAIAAVDILPALIFTKLTVSWIPSGLTSLVEVVIVIAVDLQSLSNLCELLLVRARISGKVMGSTASCSSGHASSSTDIESGLVVISTVTVPPFDSAAIAEFCLTATTRVSLVA